MTITMRRCRIRGNSTTIALSALLTVHCALVTAADIDAGPLWNDGDARDKCPAVCARNGNQTWTGQWRTTVPSVMSVCTCGGPITVLPVYPPSYGSPVVRYNDTDFVFNDVERTSAGSFDNCATQCLADNRCVAFTYSQAGSCYKKSGVGTMQHNSFATSGFIVARGAPPPMPGAAGSPSAGAMPYPSAAVPPGAVKMYGGTDFPGNDLGGSIHASSPDECASLCMGDGRCGAFTFNVLASKCYLKTGPSTFEGSFSAVSGVIAGRQAPPPGYGGTASPGYAPAMPMQPGAIFCSLVGTPKCPGCSVSCGLGQRPVCEQGVEGDATTCAKNASCTCQ